jgi:hypothetical protein
MSRYLGLSFIAIGVLLLASGVVFLKSQQPEVLAPTPSPNVIQAPASINAAEAFPSAVISASSANQPANIVIIKPLSNQTVSLPFTIEGQARVFENQFSYRIKDDQGKLLKEGTGYANAPDVGQFGDFKITVETLPNLTASGSGIIEVLEYSAKDGSEINKVSVPVNFTFK